jgi:hypothetical protein
VAHYFSGGQSAYYRSCIRMELGAMIEVDSLSVRDKFEIAITISSVCLIFAVALREWFVDREIRIVARVLGLVGWFVVASYAWTTTAVIERLETQKHDAYEAAVGVHYGYASAVKKFDGVEN